MMKNVELYKEVSLKIIDVLNDGDILELEPLLDKRQDILNSEQNIELMKKELIEAKIVDIDKKIKNLISENIDKVKLEIKEHRISKQANNSYMNFNKEKLNIFNQKV